METNMAALTSKPSISDEIINPEIISNNSISTSQNNKKKFNTFPIKLFFALILIIFLIFIILRSIEIFTTYQNAQKYKDAYEKVKEESLYCQKIKDKEAKREEFNYCDLFEKKFTDINLELEQETE